MTPVATARTSIAWGRLPWILLTGVLLALLAARWAVVFLHPDAFWAEAGGDFGLYTDGARRWLAGGSFYLDWQLAGPYQIDHGNPAILYPPTMLALLVPFTFLPPVLWWAIPLGITAAVVVHWRPAPWAWPLIVGPLVLTNAGYILVNGTPTIWIVAFVALSTVRPWLGALVLVKPSVFPFALAGIRDPRWWMLAAVVVGLSLPMAAEYVTVLRNSDGTLWYSLSNVPLLLIPVWAWLGRQSRM